MTAPPEDPETVRVPGFTERAARALRMLDAEHGADPETWKESIPQVELVLNAITDSLVAGKAVKIPGVGTLRSRIKRHWLVRPSLRSRGTAREDRVVQLQSPAVLHQGEPYEG